MVIRAILLGALDAFTRIPLRLDRKTEAPSPFRRERPRANSTDHASALRDRSPGQLLIEVVSEARRTSYQSAVPATARLPVQPISGPFQVRLDGTVGLGFWGNVPVAGLTMDQAAEAIRQHLVANPVLNAKKESIVVILDVLAYNSKRYYILFDGGGFGEQVVSFPVTGSETVLDAIANVGGLADVASKRNIWVARRTPHPGQMWQILPVDWVGLSQHGITVTNYQILPGDRIYVKAQKLVTIDRTTDSPWSSRIFGTTRLPAQSTRFRVAETDSGTSNLDIVDSTVEGGVEASDSAPRTSPRLQRGDPTMRFIVTAVATMVLRWPPLSTRRAVPWHAVQSVWAIRAWTTWIWIRYWARI